MKLRNWEVRFFFICLRWVPWHKVVNKKGKTTNFWRRVRGCRSSNSYQLIHCFSGGLGETNPEILLPNHGQSNIRIHVFGGYLWIRNFFLADSSSIHTYPANPACESATFWIHSPEWKVLNTERIWNCVDGRIRFFSNPMTLQTQIQSLPRINVQHGRWTKMLSLLPGKARVAGCERKFTLRGRRLGTRQLSQLLLSAARTPDGTCSVDNSHRGVLDARTNPDAYSIWILENFWRRRENVAD